MRQAQLAGRVGGAQQVRDRGVQGGLGQIGQRLGHASEVPNAAKIGQRRHQRRPPAWRPAGSPRAAGAAPRAGRRRWPPWRRRPAPARPSEQTAQRGRFAERKIGQERAVAAEAAQHGAARPAAPPAVPPRARARRNARPAAPPPPCRAARAIRARAGRGLERALRAGGADVRMPRRLPPRLGRPRACGRYRKAQHQGTQRQSSPRQWTQRQGTQRQGTQRPGMQHRGTQRRRCGAEDAHGIRVRGRVPRRGGAARRRLAMRRLSGQAARLLWRVLHGTVTVALTVTLLAGTGLGVLAWRLGRGPIALPWLAARIEAAADRQFAPDRLRLGQVALAWEGFHGGLGAPLDLRLADVAVRNAAGRRLMAVPRAAVTLSLPALLRLRLVPRTVAIDRPRILLRRTARGTIGLDVGTAPPGAPEAGAAPAAAPSPAAPPSAVRPAAGRPAVGPSLPRARAPPPVAHAAAPQLDLAAILTELARPPAGAREPSRFGLLSELQRLLVRDANLEVVDRQLGAVWRAPHAFLDLARAPGGGVIGEARLGLSSRRQGGGRNSDRPVAARRPDSAGGGAAVSHLPGRAGGRRAGAGCAHRSRCPGRGHRLLRSRRRFAAATDRVGARCRAGPRARGRRGGADHRGGAARRRHAGTDSAAPAAAYPAGGAGHAAYRAQPARHARPRRRNGHGRARAALRPGGVRPAAGVLARRRGPRRPPLDPGEHPARGSAGRSVQLRTRHGRRLLAREPVRSGRHPARHRPRRALAAPGAAADRRYRRAAPARPRPAGYRGHRRAPDGGGGAAGRARGAGRHPAHHRPRSPRPGHADRGADRRAGTGRAGAAAGAAARAAVPPSLAADQSRRPGCRPAFGGVSAAGEAAGRTGAGGRDGAARRRASDASGERMEPRRRAVRTDCRHRRAGPVRERPAGRLPGPAGRADGLPRRTTGPGAATPDRNDGNHRGGTGGGRRVDLWAGVRPGRGLHRADRAA